MLRARIARLRGPRSSHDTVRLEASRPNRSSGSETASTTSTTASTGTSAESPGARTAARDCAACVGIGGSGIDWHDVDSYLRPGSRYGQLLVRQRQPDTLQQAGRQFDVIVMMDCSQCPIHPELKGIFREYAKKHSETCPQNTGGGRCSSVLGLQGRPRDDGQLEDAYTEGGQRERCPRDSGGARVCARDQGAPGPRVLTSPDKRHPSLIGTFLAAATSYAALTGKSPRRYTTYNAGIDPKIAAWLQSVAWRTVQAYYATAKAR
jgi:hypothetical protein